MPVEHTKLYTILTGLVENDTQLWDKLSSRIPAIDTIGTKRTTNPIYSSNDKVWPSLENINIDLNDNVKSNIRSLSSALKDYTGQNAVKNKFNVIDGNIETITGNIETITGNIDTINTRLLNINPESIANAFYNIDRLSAYLSGYWRDAAVSAKFKSLETQIAALSPGSGDEEESQRTISIEVPQNDPVLSISQSPDGSTYTLNSILVTSEELDLLISSVDSIKSKLNS